jgi:hypothetical protein
MYFNFQDMKKVVEDLAKSQGFYSRLRLRLIEMEKDERHLEIIENWLKLRKITNAIDLVLALES